MSNVSNLNLRELSECVIGIASALCEWPLARLACDNGRQ